MNQVAPTTAIAIALALICFAFGLVQSLRLWWGPAARRRSLKKRQRRAVLGESQAQGLLAKAGYQISGAQVTVRYGILVDGEEQTIELRSDYLVRRNGKSYVAEVKTGREAPQIQTSATRRQLLEYRLAFDVDGVLLVDAESGRIRQVEFPFPEPGNSEGASRLVWTLVGMALGLAGAWYVMAKLMGR